MIDILDVINEVLWHEYVMYAVLAVGVLFTFWSCFGQYRSLTHGIALIRGKYDREGAPGAIRHFQALSTALSATVGLGNIAGVAKAATIGGPGAVFWMWVAGFVGMALKMTEVSQAMMYRNLDKPDQPRGGRCGLRALGSRRCLRGSHGLGASTLNIDSSPAGQPLLIDALKR